MNVRLKFLLACATFIALGVLLIVLINVLGITTGIPLLVVVVIIGILFLLAAGALGESVSRKPSTDNMFEAIVRSLLQLF